MGGASRALARTLHTVLWWGGLWAGILFGGCSGISARHLVRAACTPPHEDLPAHLTSPVCTPATQATGPKCRIPPKHYLQTAHPPQGPCLPTCQNVRSAHPSPKALVAHLLPKHRLQIPLTRSPHTLPPEALLAHPTKGVSAVPAKRDLLSSQSRTAPQGCWTDGQLPTARSKWPSCAH